MQDALTCVDFDYWMVKWEASQCRSSDRGLSVSSSDCAAKVEGAIAEESAKAALSVLHNGVFGYRIASKANEVEGIWGTAVVLLVIRGRYRREGGRTATGVQAGARSEA
jgi:hypothetical protein